MSKKRGSKKREMGKTSISSSFLKLVSDASLEKVRPFVISEVGQLGAELQQNQALTISALVNRLSVLENLVVEKLDVTAADLRTKVADLEDEQTGYECITEAEVGDLIRLKIATKEAAQEEFQGESSLVIIDCGKEPFTIGPELEPHLIGMQAGDEKEVPFGVDNKMTAKILVERVSRKIVTAKVEELDESQNVG